MARWAASRHKWASCSWGRCFSAKSPNKFDSIRIWVSPPPMTANYLNCTHRLTKHHSWVPKQPLRWSYEPSIKLACFIQCHLSSDWETDTHLVGADLVVAAGVLYVVLSVGFVGDSGKLMWSGISCSRHNILQQKSIEYGIISKD